MENTRKKIRVVELFAGVGGFRLGLEAASNQFETIFVNQWEPGKKVQHAFDCYVSHFGKSDYIINKDINTIQDIIPDHDLLVGGFPCQDYSVAHGNAGKGIEGKKGVLWWNVEHIIKSKKPKVVLLENVDRLITSPCFQKGRDFGIILRTLNEAGYIAEWRVINAANYGMAQRRKRTFIFAIKKELYSKFYINNSPDDIIQNSGFFASTFSTSGVNTKKQVPTINLMDKKFNDLVVFSHQFSSIFLNSGIMIDGIVTTLEIIPECKEVQTLKGILEKGSVDEKYFIAENSKLRFEKLKGSNKIPRIDGDGGIYLYSEGAISFPDAMNKPSRTILTSESSISRSTHVIVDPKTQKLRVLTPLECERLNGFPDNWTNTGMPEKARYFCMGNALVVDLVAMMAEKLLELMEVIL